MKFTKISLSLILTSIILTFFVSAGDDAPPALPSEFWGDMLYNGSPVPDDMEMILEVNGVNYAQAAVTSGGKGDVMGIGGDRELTYEGDPTCATHWGAGEACVPCDLGIPGDCVEGPQDGDIVKIKIDSFEAMPLCLSWAEGSNENVEFVSPVGDWSKNGCVNLASDFPFFGAHYDFTCPDPGWELIYDLNCDCVINLAGDFPIFGIHYEEGCGG